MSHVIQQLTIDGINRHLVATGYVAKRGRLNPNEIIIGKNSDAASCITVKLADNPSASNVPTWYIGIFLKTTPKEVSNELELLETPVMRSTHNWYNMLEILTSIISSM